MEITWYGLSCFRLAERGVATVVTDPYAVRQAGDGPLKLAADILTVSHEAPEETPLEAVSGTPYVIDGPGEYEVSGVFITGIETGGQKGLRNTLYVFDFDPLTIVHLGQLDRVLTQAEIEAIGTVNIALVPIGSEHSLNPARAAEVVSMLEPNIIIPMHFAMPGGASLDTLSKFLKEMGLSEVEKYPSLKIGRASLPEETQVIVLDYQRG
jgi:L-ascorbate metabolism protein UlaG (beta-lactamase superfamily)